jgi:hypothetical protein
MTLSSGTRLGAHEITGALGAGGMGEVYRGRDTRLDRDVAIKVLPAELAHDADRLARFEREAKLLASLNHPNIAHVYGFEGATLPDGWTVHFLAMELVEGEDLADRLKRGAISVDEAITIAKQIAEGLDEAHSHGIIHRDLKPANVKVTPATVPAGRERAFARAGFRRPRLHHRVETGRAVAARLPPDGDAHARRACRPLDRPQDSFPGPGPRGPRRGRSLRWHLLLGRREVLRLRRQSPRRRPLHGRGCAVTAVNLIGQTLSLWFNWTEELKEILAKGGVR